MSILSATVLLILVMDPFGNLPLFVGLLGDLPPRRRRVVLARELLVALAVLLAFLLAGRYAMSVLHISPPALSISGGLILFLVSIRMVLPSESEEQAPRRTAEPFIVPLAVPLVAGPAAMAILLILATRHARRLADWTVALLVAWAVVSGIPMLSGGINRLLGRRGVTAMVRLMGMILIVLAVQMFLNGVEAFAALLGGAEPTTAPAGEISPAPPW